MKTLRNLIILLCAIVLTPVTSTAQTLTAKEIVKRADEKNRGKTSQGEMTMTIVRPGWKRSVSMKVWSKGVDYFMIYITAPAKEKGHVFLKRGREMWNWVASIDRMVKIPPSMMMQSWMGSDFTNDDLVQQSSIMKDYTHKLLGKDTIRGKACYKIQLTPKPDAAVVWGKIISWITVDGFDLWKNKYYDEDGFLVNTENAYNLKKMGDRIIPTKIEMIPKEKKGQKTIIETNKMTFNKPLDEGFFSKQNMKRVR